MEEKLIRLGYKVWEKGDMKRIYINDFQKYLEVEETNTPAAMGRGRIINGICTDEYNCENCPENRGDFPHDKLPCGQQNCWVTCHCKEM